MAARISPLAAVDRQAEIADEVEIGPFCVVGPHVRIGRGTKLESHVTLMGRVTLGEENHIFPQAVIGGPPQDVSYRGSDTQVIVGDRNVFRESVTINRGTEKEQGLTRVGSNNFLMAGSHVAHDCVLGDQIIIANATLLGGHVRIGDRATLSGGVAVHHFATIGAYSFVAGLSRVLQDVPPFMLVDGSPARPRCVNVVALKRANMAPNVIEAIGEAFKLLYRGRVGVAQAREILFSNQRIIPELVELLQFIDRMQVGRHGRARDVRKAA